MTNLKERPYSGESQRKGFGLRLGKQVGRGTSFAAKVDLVTAQYPLEEREEIADLLRILTAKPPQFGLQASTRAASSRIVDDE